MADMKMNDAGDLLARYASLLLSTSCTLEERQACADQILARMCGPGEVVVPVVPTISMMHAFYRAGPYPEKPFVDGYAAMLAARVPDAKLTPCNTDEARAHNALRAAVLRGPG